MKKSFNATITIMMLMTNPPYMNNNLYAAETNTLQLANGINVSNVCLSQEAPGTQHIKYSTYKSHSFQGYGVNIQPPKTDADNAKTISDLNSLNFKYVKLDWGNIYNTTNSPQLPPAGSTYSVMYNSISPNIKANTSATKISFNKLLHDNGIKVVKTMYSAPSAYTTQRTLPDGTIGTFINQDRINDFAVFYTAYLQTLNDLTMQPDFVELQNEPNGSWDVKYTPVQFASLVQGIFQNMTANNVDANLTVSGTSTQVQNASDYLNALNDVGVLDQVKGITLHTYYVVDNSVSGGKNSVPPADDPNFSTVVNYAFSQNNGAGIPLISSEFGGSQSKLKSIDPSLENIDSAEEFKAALDLIRQGESIALAWNLYPNIKQGVAYRNWALIDEKGIPTNGFNVFKMLSLGLPNDSEVLQVKSSDISPTMNSVGHAGFRKDNKYIVGLSNPTDTAVTITLDFDESLPMALTKMFSFTSVVNSDNTRSGTNIDIAGTVKRNDCGLTVSIPAGLGVLLNFYTAPMITTNPVGTSALPGTAVTLYGDVVDNSNAKSFQWYKNGIAISGATEKNYSFNTIQGDSANYNFIAGNEAGNSSSSMAFVKVFSAPTIQTSPVGNAYLTNSNINLNVAASSDLVMTYQWYFNNNLISGATSSTYNFVAQKSNVGIYSVKVTIAVGTTNSTDANIQVLDPAVITKQPSNKFGTNGTPILFGITASGDSIQYQWYFNSVAMAGEINPRLNVVISSQTVGNYFVRVSNSLSSVDSTVVTIKMSK